MNFCRFALPWKYIFGFAWKNPLYDTPGKILPTPMNPMSDAHESDSHSDMPRCMELCKVYAFMFIRN